MAKRKHVIEETVEAAPAKGGLFHMIGRLITLPFRVAMAIIKLVLLPVRLAFALVRRVVMLAADLTYALWRGVAKVIGLVFGLVGLVFKILNATVGAVIRLLLHIVFFVPKLVLRSFGLGRKVGKLQA